MVGVNEFVCVCVFCQFCSRISGMRFCESSAKDNFNVDEIFHKLVDDILNKVGGLCLRKHCVCVCTGE